MTETVSEQFQRLLEDDGDQRGHLPDRDAASFVRDLLARTEDTSYLRGYADTCPVEGAEPHDYAGRVLQLSETCTVLVAIHFRGRDRRFPFVDVSAQTSPLPEPTPLATLVSPFKMFEPKAVRVWRLGSEDAPPGGEDDILVVGGRLHELSATPDLPQLARLRLEPDESLASYDSFLEMYQAGHEMNPDSKDWLQPESKSTLSVCASDGGLYRVFIDDEHVGLIAARRGSYRGWVGWEIVEEVLHPAYRGQRLAAPMRQAFLRRLDERTCQSVFGTIAARNVASLRVAQRVGRRVVEVGCLVSITSVADDSR